MKTAVASLASQPRKKAWPAPGKIPIDQRDRREAEQHERDDLGEDHRERERAEQHDGAERAEEHDDRERQALEGAAGLLDVDRGRVGLVDLVAGELRIEPGAWPFAQRVVFGLALVRAGRLAQEARGVAAVAVAAGLRWSRQTSRGRVVRADGPWGSRRASRWSVSTQCAEPAELEHHPRPVDRASRRGGRRPGAWPGRGRRASRWLAPERNASESVLVHSAGLPDRLLRAGRRRTARSARTRTETASAPAVSV